MKPTGRIGALRVSLLANDLSYKLQSHLEFIVVTLIIVLVVALATPLFRKGVVAVRVSELYTSTSIVRAEVVAYYARTGRWPDAGAALRVPPLVTLTDTPVGTQFETLTYQDGGVLQLTPSENLAQAADLNDQSYWLTPHATAPVDGAPIIWVCTTGKAAPTAADVAARLSADSHLPPNFCQ